MAQTGPIVVGIDGSASSRAALVWAAEKAERRGRPLVAVIAWHYPAQLGTIGVAVDLDLEGAARGTLDRELQEVLGERAASVGRRVAHGHAAAALVQASGEAELLVVGSRGHSGLSSVLLGSVNLHCVTHASCTVVVVRG